MSGFSAGSFSFSRSGRRGGFLGHSHSSGHRRGVGLGGLLGGSHSSGRRGRRGRYVQGGHYRQVRRPKGCLGAFVFAAVLTGSGLVGLVQLIA